MTETYIHNPKVSIIIPIYNVEPYILTCAESLFKQTYRNIEYIFINDASPDNSLPKLEQLAKRYNNRDIKILNNPTNQGLSKSRNNGIKEATGDYITFCDSDDWIEPTAIAEMTEKAIQNNADVIVTPFYTNTFSKEKILSFPSRDIADLNSIPIDFMHFSLCNKLIRTSFFKDNSICPIPGIDCWEDLSVTSRLYALCPKTMLLDKPFYHYRKFEHKTLSSASHERQLNDRLKYTEFLIKWFSERNLTEKYIRFLNHLKFTAKIKLLRTSPRQFRRWKYTYPESNKHILSYKDIPMHYRLLFYIADLIIHP